MHHKLKGIIPPIVTPFAPDGELDLTALKANISAWNSTGLSGYLVLGSNGESVYLSQAEKETVLAEAVRAAGDDKFIMAGTGCESTDETIAFTNRAAEIGAHCALVVTPFYFKGGMTPAALRTHFTAVADGAKIPILLYNVPQFTGINLTPDQVVDLAAHENIVGIKDSSGNLAQLGVMAGACPDDFAVFVGAAPVLYPALCLGAVGGILAVANCAPQVCVNIYEVFRGGDHAGALELQRAMSPLAAMVTTGYGVGGLKTAMGLAGYEGGVVRPPLCMPAGDDAAQRMAAELQKLGVID